ncbi:MAG: GIY-YIG nuclease family protein [Bacteroidales bacterium]|nr:GIY-YIG nuclease family protein [Bacteroidales bacterium]
MKQLFSVVDIETTGGSSRGEKITEIAIYVTDGTKIIDSFCTLIHPEKRVSSFITGLTGITNEMLEDAPKFFEVAAKIVEITKDTVFVAHNVNFDYNFVKQEFAQLGYKYRQNTLCTLQLSRKMFPGLRSYSLGNLCKSLNVNLDNQHRAYADAFATTEIFNMIYQKDIKESNGININGFSLNGINPMLDIGKIKNLPEKCGVYYLYNAEKELIYIGKSKNIHSRVMSHLRNEKTGKALNMRSQIADVDYELTGSELIALLKESHEIKQNIPIFNKAQRRSINNWAIFTYEDSNGYICFYIDHVDKSEESCVAVYSSKAVAGETLTNYCIKYNLCQKLSGLYQSAGACFYYGLGECKGACVGAESSVSYNKRAKEFIAELNLNLTNVFIIPGDCDDEKQWVVAIKDSKYYGYGFVDEITDLRSEDMLDLITKYPENKDVRQIIRTYLKTKKNYRIVEF